MKFLRAVIFILFLVAGKTSIAQITCDFDSVYTGSRCAPYVVIDTAKNTSPFPICERRWYLTGPGGFSFTVVNGGLNPIFSNIVTVAGTYCLRLWATNCNNDTCSITKCFVIADKPTISATFSPTEGCAPLNVTASISNCTAGTGTVASVQIDWGCGLISPYNSCPPALVNHLYTCIPGCYSPVIIIQNTAGCVTYDTTHRNGVCIIPPVTACFTADTTSANCATGPLTVNFTACNNVGNNITYSWYINGVFYPNGGSPNFPHVFPINNSDCYDVKLVVRHPSGCADSLTKTDYICVRSTPLISFTANDDTACAPFTLILTNTTPGLSTLNWSLTGPGCPIPCTASGNTASFPLTAAGTYTATATGVFGPGCTATITRQVLVLNATPVVNFTANSTYSCKDSVSIIYTATPCANCIYNWSLSGGTPNNPSGQVVSTTYNNFGTFPARVDVRDAVTGCTSFLAKFNYIRIAEINPVIGQNRVAGCAPVCATFTDLTNYSLILDPISSKCWKEPDSPAINICGVNSFSKCFSSKGCHEIMLIVTTTTGCIDTGYLADSICVGYEPHCTVTHNPDTICFETLPLVVSMNCDSFDYFIVDWGDGNIIQWPVDSGPILEHVFEQIGLITTTIIPYGDSCAADSIIFTTYVKPPFAKFTTTSSCLTGDTVCMINQTATGYRYKWYFCNGDTSNLFNPCVPLPPCDTCRVRLVVSDSLPGGCVNEKINTITTACGLASVSPAVNNVCATRFLATRQVFFNNTSTSISSTRWDADTLAGGIGPRFGGPAGTTFNSYYNAPGLYTLAMENTSTSLCVDTAYARVKICKPIADFTNNSACYPDSICFTNTTVDQYCNITFRRWTFGDGRIDTVSVNPCHKYDTAGVYTVKLLVENDMGCRDSITHTVIVSDSVSLNYKVDTLMCPGTTHCIVNNSTGVALTYQWTIPNATYANSTTDTSAAPCYTISTQGDYWAVVAISSNNLCTTRDSVLVHVCPPVASGYVTNNFFACPDPNNPVQFISTSTCFNDVLTWNFGDQVRSNLDTTSHFYGYPGRYPICLTVTTTDGCSSTNCIDTIVVEGPYGTFTVLDTPGICACKDTVHFSISTVNSISLILLYGCNQGIVQTNPILPIGTTSSPTVLNFAWPYCLLDTCRAQLIYGDTLGCIVYENGPRIIIDSPVVDFTYDNYGACVDGRVCFFDSTTYRFASNLSYSVSWLWDFGDNDTSTLQNPCHIYALPGTYRVKLYVTSNVGCYDSSFTQTVFIPQFPVAGYYADDSTICANTSVCFHDTSSTDPLTAVEYTTWDFGDNSGTDTSYIDSVCHTYTTGGFYTVIHCVYDSVGCPDCDSSTVIQVIDNPVADAGLDRIVCYGVTVNLNGTGGGIGGTCQWSPPALVSVPNICNPTTQLFNDTSFTLIVSDVYQCVDTDTVALSVARVNAAFNVPATACLNDSVCVTDASTSINGILVSWTYDFGDGVPVSGANVCHKYSATGTYNILQTVTDSNGCIDTTVRTILVNPSPVAAFTISAPVICSNIPLCVTDASTSITPIDTWDWYYGPGQAQGSGQNPPCHTFGPPYQGPVTLVVTDTNNCADSATVPVTVNEAPQANFSWSISCVNEPMPLASTSIAGDAAIATCLYTWLTTPLQVIATSCNTSFVFPIGPNVVQLIVTDLNGCADTIQRTVQTNAATDMSVNPADTTICLGGSVSYSPSGIFTSINWSPCVWLSDSTCSTADQTITPLGNVSYIVSAINGTCPPALDTVTIHVIQPIPIEVTASPDRIVLGLSSTITSQIPGQIDSIIWTPDSTLDCRDCANPIATPTQTTTYYATIYYSQNGVTCTNVASVTIEFLNSCDDVPPYIPNTFTPNGDGQNDIFMIRGVAGKKINYFRIFDRWGKLMFESTNGEFNDPRWGWDGTDKNGKKLNPAVFVYTYEIECVNGETKTGKGNVSLVR